MVSIAIKMLCIAKFAPISLCDVPYEQLTEKENSRELFDDSSAHYAGTTQKWTAATLYPFCWTTLKDNCTGWFCVPT